jgi:D-tyrosyl-tRNA(Tyr) deacylase
MRAVVQRAGHGRVAVDGEKVGEIGQGLVVLVGVAEGDTEADAVALADKIAGLRIFPDDAGRMNRSVIDAGGAILLISQFTLLADVRKGRRPSFTGAAGPEEARRLVDVVQARLTAAGLEVAGGRFGTFMQVDLRNDGPVTIVVDTADGRVV